MAGNLRSWQWRESFYVYRPGWPMRVISDYITYVGSGEKPRTFPRETEFIFRDFVSIRIHKIMFSVNVNIYVRDDDLWISRAKTCFHKVPYQAMQQI